MNSKKHPKIQTDSGLIKKEHLSNYTFARVNLPKSGFAINMSEVLAFRADHASARDAIFTAFDIEKIKGELSPLTLDFIEVSSQAEDKAAYLKRPDLGRMLNEKSNELLEESVNSKEKDIVIVISNGLSATAVNENTASVLNHLIPKIKESNLTLAPIIFATNGRVALADEIGEKLNAKLSIILVGERPGLSSPNSMSIYFTYAPEKGLTDESRNCISNIRDKGLPPISAAEKLFYLVNTALTKRISGIHLKDDMGLTE
ncbi:ethanolamine ammonia-lyase light chain [Neptunitalea chrysea]|uniref:Ethanolamine ammonia-lyase small subunit n=1 Tax=Neptunitalea chrysea TaxID=1647581 RepID=A0A9W6B415_9FLAO|nr:ethanolamine ammonia-lyase subunit EutC [Neptunitalea chrysea]GLB51180.1 ethanolamine ammonia-lyase light chain [Neptunitalea chrysea]